MLRVAAQLVISKDSHPELFWAMCGVGNHLAAWSAASFMGCGSVQFLFLAAIASFLPSFMSWQLSSYRACRMPTSRSARPTVHLQPESITPAGVPV